MTHDISGLQRKISALNEAMRTLNDAKHAESLQLVIQHPGWTTIAEFDLVQAYVADLHRDISGVHEGLDRLVKIAEKIGKQ